MALNPLTYSSTAPLSALQSATAGGMPEDDGEADRPLSAPPAVSDAKPPTWQEAKARLRQQNYNDDEIEAVRPQYFNDVIAPRFDAAELPAIRKQFDADTGPSFLRTLGEKHRAAAERTGRLFELSPRTANDRRNFYPIIEQAAQANGLRPELLDSLIRAESNYNPTAVSPKGAKGLGQLMPDTAKELGVDPENPEQNIWGTARYLRQMIEATGSEPLGVAAYNSGLRTVKEHGGIPQIPETQNHVRKVMLGAGTEIGGAPANEPAGGWLKRQGQYLWTDVQMGWNNLADAFNGARAANAAEGMRNMESLYGMDHIELNKPMRDQWDALNAEYRSAMERSGKNKAEIAALMPLVRPETRLMLEDKGDWSQQLNNLAASLSQNPVGVVADLTLQSLPQTVAMIAAAFAASKAGLPAAGVAAAGGGTSAFMEFGNDYADFRQQGVPHDVALKKSAVKSGVIGLFDAVSLVSAGAAINKVTGAGLFHNAGELVKETGRQAALGGGGESIGTFASGDTPSVSNVAAEMLGELGGTPLEIGGLRGTPLDRTLDQWNKIIQQSQWTVPADQVAREQMNPDGNVTPGPRQPPPSTPPGETPAQDAQTAETATETPVSPTTTPTEPTATALQNEALANLTPEERAAVEGIQAGAEPPPVQPGATGAGEPESQKRRGKVRSPEEIAAKILPDDILADNGKPFASAEDARTVRIARNLSGYRVQQLGRDHFVLRKGGQAAATTTPVSGNAPDREPEASQQAPGTPFTKPDGSGWGTIGGLSKALRDAGQDPSAYTAKRNEAGHFVGIPIPGAAESSGPPAESPEPSAATPSEQDHGQGQREGGGRQEVLTAPAGASAPADSADGFAPTHQLPDGRPVIAMPGDAAGMWIDSNGEVIESPDAKPLESQDSADKRLSETGGEESGTGADLAAEPPEVAETTGLRVVSSADSPRHEELGSYQGRKAQLTTMKGSGYWSLYRYREGENASKGRYSDFRNEDEARAAADAWLKDGTEPGQKGQDESAKPSEPPDVEGEPSLEERAAAGKRIQPGDVLLTRKQGSSIHVDKVEPSGRIEGRVILRDETKPSRHGYISNYFERDGTLYEESTPMAGKPRPYKPVTVTNKPAEKPSKESLKPENKASTPTEGDPSDLKPLADELHTLRQNLDSERFARHSVAAALSYFEIDPESSPLQSASQAAMDRLRAELGRYGFTGKHYLKDLIDRFHPADHAVTTTHPGGAAVGAEGTAQTPADTGTVPAEKPADAVHPSAATKPGTPDQAALDAAAHEAATSPENDLPAPTEAQKEAGNYQKGHVRVQGMDISIENPQGSERSGTDPNGKAWSVTMAHHYGYLRGTVGRDKDHIDVFIGPKIASPRAYVVDQVDPQSGLFDEHKIMLGFASVSAAREGYLANYADGWQGLGAITPVPIGTLKLWLKDGDTHKPYDATVPTEPPKPKRWQDVTVRVQAVSVDTGRKGMVEDSAESALADVDQRRDFARRLLECLAS